MSQPSQQEAPRITSIDSLPMVERTHQNEFVFGIDPMVIEQFEHVLEFAKETETAKEQNIRLRTWAESGILQVSKNSAIGQFVDARGDDEFRDGKERMIFAGRNIMPQAIGLLHQEGPQITRSSSTLSQKYAYPTVGRLPALPTPQPDGRFVYDGSDFEIGAVERDMMYSAHYLARHPEYAEYGRLYVALAKTVSQAQSGEIVVPEGTDYPQGAMSFARQMARFSGYDVNQFELQQDGMYHMAVGETHPAYFEKITLLLRNGVPASEAKAAQDVLIGMRDLQFRAPAYLALKATMQSQI